MKKTIFTPKETEALIKSGCSLAIAADEAILRHLPKGNWIGGTIPYFIGEEGGLQSREMVQVTVLAEAGSPSTIADYSSDTIPRIATDAPDHGFTVLIIPGMSALHTEFAAHSQDYPELFMKPIVGWISGVHLDDLGKIKPKVINGQTGSITDDRAVAIHVPLAENKMAIVRIINLFQQGEGDVLTFPKDGFSVSDCLVNGEPANFASYVQTRGLDLALPLVADYSGAQINVSFQAVDAEKGLVSLYAPVFSGIEYKQAKPVGDYVENLESLLRDTRTDAHFACNCILNYLHGKLEGRKTGDFTGPVTFGEIGYQLLNQTLVYLEIHE